MNSFGTFILCDGTLSSCAMPSEAAPEAGALCVVEIDGVREFGRFLRRAAEHAPCHGNSLGEYCQVAGDEEQTKLSGNEQAVQRARAAILKWADEAGKAVLALRLRFSIRRERLSILLHAGEFFNPAPLNELLEKRFQTKVAMRTASPREISGAVGGLGVCGCMLCCHDGVCARTSVDVRLAKLHGVPMHDSAASGLCGRLKCCIGYETDGVEDNSVRRRPERRGATR